jgi:uncharacterized RDD family membrane protein YckC
MSQRASRVRNTRLRETNLASRWKRLGGALIDGLVSLVVFLPLTLVTGGQEQILNGQQLTIGQQVAFFVVGYVVFLLLNGYLLYRKGQTIGKLVVKARMVDLKGHIPHFGKLFVLRYVLPSLVVQIPVLGSLVAIVDVLFIFGQENRCLHDHLAGTWVINE